MIICLETSMKRTFVSSGIIDDASFIRTMHFVLSDSVLSALTFEIQNGASLFGFLVYVTLVSTFVGNGTTDDVSIIFFRFVLSNTILYSLRVEIQNDDFSFDSMVWWQVLPTCFGAEVVSYVSSISILRFVLTKSVICLLTLKLQDCASFVCFVVGLVLMCILVKTIILCEVKSFFCPIMFSRSVIYFLIRTYCKGASCFCSFLRCRIGT